MLKVGDKAPHFLLPSSNGETVDLNKLLGKKIVLFFYPKDNTPGCIKEVCSFRDVYTEIKKLGVVLLGVSADSLKSHNNFVSKYELPFVLLSDIDKSVWKAYFAWGPKKRNGREYMGMHRVTYIIDEKGHIFHVWSKVSPTNHGVEVLEIINSRP